MPAEDTADAKALRQEIQKGAKLKGEGLGMGWDKAAGPGATW